MIYSRTFSRYDRLKSFTTQESMIKELLAYTQNKFCPDGDFFLLKKMKDEPQVSDWLRYLEESKSVGVYEVLTKYLVQFRFPIQENITQENDYRSATLKGASTVFMPIASGLELEFPDRLELSMYDSIAGKIPVLVAENRHDFQAIVRALAYKNEPQPLPDSMGAIMIQGINNWDRLRKFQKTWKANRLAYPNSDPADLLKNKVMYQDRLIVLGRLPYSNVSAEDMGVDRSTWIEQSLQIRLAHECAHYYTLRQFGVMSNNMHDELIADYLGICSVRSSFSAEWFLRFIGLENYPIFRTSGRLKNYLGKPPLSNSAFKILQTIMKKAADHVEQFDKIIYSRGEDENHLRRVLTLCRLDLTEMASEYGTDLLLNTYQNLRMST